MSLKCRHVAFIMDGNRRWAKKNNLSVRAGHEAGLNNMLSVIKFFVEKDHSLVLSFYAFSKENWFRNFEEIYGMFFLIDTCGDKILETFIELEVRVQVMGDKFNLPVKVVEWITKLESSTAAFTKLTVLLFVNYSGRQDIVQAVHKLKDVEHIDEHTLSRALYSGSVPDPDLCIRTGGEKRISNFCLWNLAYTEIEFEDALWPEFSIDMLENILNKYKLRSRRFGI
ncbi:MAG: di-trans,poly-cis-decaprenylcistransferase [Alphaproteobacteria bacterium]|nr:MAG: di-trans,poly-cis-decaprenylcistransferase [Alphaproteobacteria bacterium]